MTTQARAVPEPRGEARRDAAAPRPAGLTLDDFLDETAARVPGRPAFVTAGGTWSFARLRGDVLAAAGALARAGIRKGDCVAIVMRNSPGFVTAYLALSRLGAVAVPINFLVTKPEELRFMLADCAAVGVFTAAEFLPGLLKAREGLPALASVWSVDGADASKGVSDFKELLRRDAPSPPAPSPVGARTEAGDVAAILYTSGTTGHPKGVMLTHANLVSNCEASIEVMGLTERDVSLTILPMFHTFAWTAGVLISLRLGIKNVIVPAITPAKPWLSLMGRHGVTIFAAVPPVYGVLAREACGLKGLVLKHWFFRSVRLCVSGAAPLSPETARAFQAAFGLPILEGYGLTETSPVATINPPRAPRAGSVGVPIPGVEISIVNDDGAPVARGEEGEICIRGPNVMKGYHNRPDATRETITPEGWLKTGDVGVIDAQGYLSIRDRKKDMIIVKGLKVFSAQVEAVISEHPDVQEVAVVGIPDGSGDEIIKAFVVPRPGAAPEKSALMKFFREKLDAYKRPRDLEFVEALPKNALQKVLKRVLRQQELDRRTPGK